MQTPPVELPPVEPAPRTARRDPAGRGFADLLAGDEPAAKPDGSTAGRQKPPGETATQPQTAPDSPTDAAGYAGPKTASHGAAAPDSGDPLAATVAGLPEAAETAPQAPAAAAPGAPQFPHGAAPPAAVPPAADVPATASATHENAAPEAATAAGPAAASRAPDVAAMAPDSAPPAAGENAPPPARTEAVAAAPAASGALDGAATAVATAAPRQTGAIRSNGAGAGAALPAPASPAAPAAAAGGRDSANGLTQSEADTAFGPPESTPGQNKARDMTGRTTAPAQPPATGQAIEQPGGGTRAGAPEAVIAGSEPGVRAEAPPTGHAAAQGQSASPPASFANELRLATGAPSAPDAAAGRTPPGPVIDQMAVQISRAVSDGQDKLTIDLRPAVLGRVSVSLEVGHDHRVIAVISADRADTLELLQRDVRTLERALQDAGLKTDSGSLSFSLNGDGAKKSPFSDGANPEQLVAAQPSDDGADAPPAAHNPYARVLNPAGIDIHV